MLVVILYGVKVAVKLVSESVNFLCAHWKSDFKRLTYEHDLWQH